MDAPITRDELVHFAQQMAWLAFFAGVAGAMLIDVLRHGLGVLLESLWRRAERKARIKAALARARAASGGMGQRPMLDPSRMAYPHQGAESELVRQYVASRGPRFTPAPAWRVVKHSDDPRSQAQDQAGPDSCLKDKRAGGAPDLRCAHGASGDSVETPSVLEELTLAPLGPSSGRAAMSRAG